MKHSVWILAGAVVVGSILLNAGGVAAQGGDSKSAWQYARWVEAPGVSIWITGEREVYGTSMYETYKALGGRTPEADYAKPNAKDAVLRQAGLRGWELCAVDTEGSTVYYFKRPAR